MLQSSITAWLKKPAAVTQPEAPPSPASLANTASPTGPTSPPSPPPPAHLILDVAREEYETPLTHGLETPPLPKRFSLPPLPANVELVPLTEDLVPAFKRLNALTLPMAYPASFYKEAMTEPHHSLTLMALWHSTPLADAPPSDTVEKPRLVGAIRCRILPSSNLYLATLCLLAPYRSHGIATHLLYNMAAKASKLYELKWITAHVWEGNEDGLEWYSKRGFEAIGEEDGYYRKLRPSTAVLVRKPIGVEMQVLLNHLG
ncbi:hypothetical protein P154DRAFT_356328 [Amniculicola lignicola CBS 123094]|uniref:N-acetyltransferase domain-containing protein n=1 Tax=Amniculicola lignicola CBS 123094 TaxID=1392246 RepID=A0A6A5WTV9_9PLEO|nr:hypothetical protein P154DRAFT_356328 [Amniculicola lignicola CBS 123094]